MKDYFEMMARYNAWVNKRLYELAAELPDEAYHRDVGAFFRSLHGTLNHLLVADQIWMRRLTGTGEHADRLDAILFDNLSDLTGARQAEDRRILAYIAGLSEADLAERMAYRTMNGTPHDQPRSEVLAHFFNHQTHHRGQAHAILTQLGIAEPAPWDLLVMLREQATG